MNEPIHHHYLSVFYLSRWVGSDGRICRFSRPYGDAVKAGRVAPKAARAAERSLPKARRKRSRQICTRIRASGWRGCCELPIAPVLVTVFRGPGTRSQKNLYQAEGAPGPSRGTWGTLFCGLQSLQDRGHPPPTSSDPIRWLLSIGILLILYGDFYPVIEPVTGPKLLYGARHISCLVERGRREVLLAERDLYGLTKSVFVGEIPINFYCLFCRIKLCQIVAIQFWNSVLPRSSTPSGLSGRPEWKNTVWRTFLFGNAASKLPIVRQTVSRSHKSQAHILRRRVPLIYKRDVDSPFGREFKICFNYSLLRVHDLFLSEFKLFSIEAKFTTSQVRIDGNHKKGQHLYKKAAIIYKKAAIITGCILLESGFELC